VIAKKRGMKVIVQRCKKKKGNETIGKNRKLTRNMVVWRTKGGMLGQAL
jgi:hypothetical protein